MTDSKIDIQELRDFMAKVMGWKIQGIASYKENWKPDLDSNQLDMLVDKMVEDKLNPVLKYNPVMNSWIVYFWTWDNGRLGEDGIHKDRRLAVLLAIKAAKT